MSALMVATHLNHHRIFRKSLFIGLLLTFVAIAGPAQARTVAAPEPTQGMLVIAGERPVDAPAAFPLSNTSVHAHIAGFVAQVKVRQTFNNPFTKHLEAIYVFPLPQNAAVGEMTIRVDGRVIRGIIKERGEARRIYRKAKREGKTTALLEQERPNIFTQSVANISPGKDVIVEITYDVSLAYDKGIYEFVYPMVVGPRYIPGNPTGKSAGGRAPDTDQVPDASRITPPVRKPGSRSGHDINVEVTIDPGMPIRSLVSPTHQIQVDRPKHRKQTWVTIRLAPAARIPNKDLVVRYRLTEDKPGMSVLAERGEGEGYFAIMVEPPVRLDPAAARPKELFFVVDTSGSMRGEPMSLVKRAMRYAIKNLNPSDTFQIIRFSSSASSLSPKPLTNTPKNVRRALSYINGMDGSGGTEMITGVRAALRSRDDAGRLRIVCFMTDGYIGNETAILSEIERLIDRDTRLFSFGVGSSVNRYLLDRMAEAGRGAVQYMLLDEPPEHQVKRFYERIRAPVLTHLDIDWGGLQVSDVSPARIPDLFVGQPLAVIGRYGRAGRGTIKVRAQSSSGPVSFRLPVTLPSNSGVGESRALGRLWARAKIRELMTKMRQGDREALARQVTELALKHALLSKYTAFVAVDERIVNEGGKTRVYQVPVEMPEGVLYKTTIRDRSTEDGDYGDDDDDDYDALEGAYNARAPADYAKGEAIMIVGKRSIKPRGSWRLALGAGIGPLTAGAVEDEASLSSSLYVRAGRYLTPRLVLGVQGALLLPQLDSDLALANLMLEFSYMGLLNGLLELSLGAGPALPFDGGLGAGYYGGLEFKLPVSRAFTTGLQLRYDGARVDEDSLGSITLGLQVSF